MAQGSIGGPIAAGSSKSNAGPRPQDRLAPTSEKYSPDSAQHRWLQVQWQKRNFPSEAVFRVYIAIGALRKAAAEYVEEMDHKLSWVGPADVSVPAM